VKITISPSILVKRILIIALSFLLLLILIWFGYSLFSMNSSNPTFVPFVDIRKDALATKVQYESVEIDGKRITYKFEIIPLEVSKDESNYIITGVAKNYFERYEDIEDTRFVYSLPKGIGEFDFSSLEWGQPILLTTQYRVEKDFKYFIEYSWCILTNGYYKLIGSKERSTDGFCPVERDINRWSVEVLDVTE